MARTSVSYEPRTGLDTSTGNRSAARMAGGFVPDIPFKRKEGVIPQQQIQDAFQGLIDKQTEKERVRDAAQKARNAYESGTPAPLNSAGSQTIADAQADRTLNNTASNLKIANQGYSDRGNIDLANEIAKKNFGLGQYANKGGVTTVTSVGGSASSGASAFQSQMRESDERAQAWQMQQRAANTAQSQVDTQRAVGLENAQAQKYAAAVAANAQRDAAAYSMMGQFAGQGGYKYWGG